MLDIYIDAFGSTFKSVLQILIIVLAAFLLIRRRIITQEQLKALSAITVRVFLPCLVFSNIMKNFYPARLPIWPIIPLSAVAMIGLGLGISAILFLRELPQKKNMLALAGFQNAGYLILPLGMILYPDQFEEFKLYCFLYILGISPVLWSLGKYMISSSAESKISIRELLTPPFIANLLALAFVFTGIRSVVPSLVLNSIEFVGSATVPVALFILGAMLGSISFRLHEGLFDTMRVLLVKMVLIPLITIAFLYFFKVGDKYPVLAGLLVLQAASAPAVGLIIQVKHYGGDEQKVSSILLLSYVICIISIPFWLAAWTVVTA